MAEQGLEAIYEFTAREFGQVQADQYIRVLFDKFQVLAETPVWSLPESG
ncbi:MAG: type II toxin-antitoxin system RelE/ParE family toxin [Endozoicomonas sp.]